MSDGLKGDHFIPVAMLSTSRPHTHFRVPPNSLTEKRRHQRIPAQLHPGADAKEVARGARLRYVSDTEPGYSRKRHGHGFVYVDDKGRRLRDAATLRRIQSLAIPPAYSNVWISPHENGHIQATGRDVRGRKQYRYHPRWREIRDADKYNRMIAFGAVLPRIRKRVARDLALPGMPRNKVLATLVRLLETTHIRVGNEEYQRSNHSFGLTTLRNRHIEVKGTTLRFQFRGKGGKHHDIAVEDPRVSRIVRQCLDIPGQQLFQYLDEEGHRHSVTSGDLNEYLHDIAGADFTAKDFRTWAGTLIAARELRSAEPCTSIMRSKQNVLEAIRRTAERLGNTAAICRKCYIHPEVLRAYLNQGSSAFWKQGIGASRTAYRAEEKALLAFLRVCSRAEKKLARLQ